MSFGQEVITHWSFAVDGDLSSDNGVGQDAQLIGGTTEAAQDDALRVTNFPDQFENSGTAGIELMLSTEGYEHILMEYQGRTSGTMSRWAEIHYTLDSGAEWHALQDNDGGLFPRDEWHEFMFDFSAISGANNNPNFGIRIVSVFAPVDFEDGLGNEFDANTAYQRSRVDGGSPYSGEGNWRFLDVKIMGELFDDENGEQDEPVLVHFFVFDGDLANNTPFEELEFTYSLNEPAHIYFHSALDGYPFDPDHPNWRKASMERRNAPTPINYRPEGNAGVPYEDAGVRGLQVKQPFTGDGGENTMIFHLPTVGFENVVFSFAAKDEDAADMMIIDYSVVEGDPVWIEDGLSQTEFALIDEFELFEIDFEGIDNANDNPSFRIRMRFDGEDMEEDEGERVTFNNFTLDGYFIETDLPASKLSIVAVNDGDPVYVDEPFSLSIQVLNEDNIPTAVEEDTEVTISLASGNGTLGGNLTGVIEGGEMSLVIEGILYDTVEEGVSIMVDAEGLEGDVSDEFSVHVRTYVLTLESFPPGAGELTGGGDYEEGAEVTVSAVAGEGFVFTHWSFDDEEITTDAEFVFTMPAEDVTLTANFEMLGDYLLVHYWHFNNEEMDDEDDYKVVSDFSLVGQGEITYPGEGDGYMDFRTHRESDPVSNFNLRLGEEPDQGAVLRARNPAITRELIIAAPSTGFIDLVVTFATTRTENGSQAQQFYFSADAGNTWVPVGDAYDIPFIEDEEGIYLHKEIDLSEYEEVNDNPDLHFKILFVGEGNDNPSGNNRFDNLTLDGWSIGEVSIEDVVAADITMQVYPNPTHGIFNIDVDQPDMLIRIYNLQGKLVYQRAMSGNTISIDASGFESGLYIIQGISPTGNASVSKRLLVQ